MKEWDISFPLPLALEENGDLNEGLFDNPVSVGDEICFGFSCRRTTTKTTTTTATTENEPDATPAPKKKEELTLHVVLQDEIGKIFHQVLPLDLDAFYEQMKKEDEYAGMNTATAELKCTSREGVVGCPARFSFDVDISNLATLSMMDDHHHRLLYSISCDAKDWILAGRTQGIVASATNNDDDATNKLSSFSVDFVGIPTRSGLLTRFPEIRISYADGKDDIPSIIVHCNIPESFRSLSHTNHMALATPSVVEIPLNNHG